MPDWRGLLKHFAYEIKADDFAYSAYENKASKEETPEGLLPKVAELIQIDYDEKWFSDPNIRTLNKDMLIKVKEGLSPFKAEVASYIIFMGYKLVAKTHRLACGMKATYFLLGFLHRIDV